MTLPPLPPPTDVHALLLQMHSVMRGRPGYPSHAWVARAYGHQLHGHGATPVEAMRNALEVA